LFTPAALVRSIERPFDLLLACAQIVKRGVEIVLVERSQTEHFA
jgi:hypothetical protein